MNYRMIFKTLGKILSIEGILLIIPLILSLIYQENIFYAYLISMGLMLLVGLPLALLKPSNRGMYVRDGFVLVGLCWIGLSLFGALPFFISREIPSYIDALFETVSGFTTTGATILKDVEVMSKSLLFWRSFTHWIGGMGVLVFVLAILPNSEGQNIYLLRAESTGPQVGKLVSKVRFTARILYVIYLAMTIIMVVLLLCGGNHLFDSVILSMGTAGTGGFAILNSGLATYSSYTQIIVTIFMFLFGINFNIYYFILIGKVKQAFKNEELRWYVGIILMAATIICLSLYFNADKVLAGTANWNVGDYIKHSFFQVVSVITTTGFSTTDFNVWPLLPKIVLFVLMFVGGCAGSTGGGVKVSRFVILFKSLKREVNKLIHPNSVSPINMDGETLDEGVVRGVTGYFALIIVLLFLGFFIVSFNNLDFESSFTAVVTCINNVGPGFGGAYSSMADFNIVSKITLTITMLIGRLEVYPILLLFMPKVWSRK